MKDRGCLSCVQPQDVDVAFVRGNQAPAFVCAVQVVTALNPLHFVGLKDAGNGFVVCSHAIKVAFKAGMDLTR